MGILSSVPVSAIAIVVSFALFIFLTVKGVHLIPSAMLCGLFMAFFTTQDLQTAFFQSYVAETLDFAKFILILFITGGLLGVSISESGCGASMANTFVKWFGVQRAPLVIVILTFIVTLSGAPTVPFIVAPVIMSLFKKANLPRGIGLAAMLGTMQPTCVVLPFVPNSLNIFPTYSLGTTTGAAPLMGFICFAFAMCLVGLYLFYLVKKARCTGEGFDGDPNLDTNDNAPKPHFIIAILPIIIVVAASILLGSNGFKIMSDDYAAVSVAQMASCVFIWLTCMKFLKGKNFGRSMVTAIKMNVEIVIGVCCIVGYSELIQNTSAFAVIQENILQWSIHPYLLTFLVVAIISAICANGYGGMQMFLNTLGKTLASIPGVSAEAVHRISTMTSSTFDSLPHASVVFINLQVMKMTLKDGYKYVFVTTVVITTLTSLLGVALGVLFY